RRRTGPRRPSPPPPPRWVSMERAARLAPDSGSHLAPTIDAFAAQLGTGVRQYNEMVAAAARLVASANGQRQLSQRYRDDLVNATDRMVGWAQAFDELERLPQA